MSDGGVLLPLELLEHIIDILAVDHFEPDSRRALFSCTLVCKAFYDRALGWLISDLRLGTGGEAHDHLDAHVRLHRQLGGLSSLLDARPYLASRVKALTIETWFGGVSPTDDRELLLDSPHIPVIFPKLSSIVSFSWLNHDKVFPWSSFRFPILEAFSKLMTVPTLKSLTFESIEDLPASYIARCTALEQLRLVHVDPLETDDADPGVTEAKAQREDAESQIQPRLHTMVNRNAPNIILRILSYDAWSASMFSRLRALHVWMRKEDEIRAAWAVMQSASETLEVLDIQDMSHFGYPILIPGPIDIGILKSLRTIKICCVIASGDGVTVPRGIGGLLTPPTSPLELVREIEITINWIDCRIGSEDDRLSDLGWTALDQTLSRLSTFPALQRVIVTLKLGYGWSVSSGMADPPDRIVRVRDRLLRLASGLLPITAGISTVKTNINVLIYNSPYASNSAYY